MMCKTRQCLSPSLPKQVTNQMILRAIAKTETLSCTTVSNNRLMLAPGTRCFTDQIINGAYCLLHIFELCICIFPSI